MIEAKHNSIARFIFNAYEFRILKKAFNRFILLNDEIKINKNQSVILLPNHFSWWDGFLVDFLIRNTIIDKKFNIIMLEEQLKRYWFFRLLGATGFNPNNPKSIVKLSNFISNILQYPDNVLVFYPQGVIQLFDSDIAIKEGLSYLLKNVHKDVQIFYPFFKIQYFDNRLPDLICKIYTGVNVETIINDFSFFKRDFAEKFDDFKKVTLNSTLKNDLFVSEE